MKASVAVFSGQARYRDYSPNPDVPDSLFEAAERVVATGVPEFLRHLDGTYVVLPAKAGPFAGTSSVTGWLPVRILRLEVWRSGGISDEEMAAWKVSKASIHDPGTSEQ